MDVKLHKICISVAKNWRLGQIFGGHTCSNLSSWALRNCLSWRPQKPARHFPASQFVVQLGRDSRNRFKWGRKSKSSSFSTYMGIRVPVSIEIGPPAKFSISFCYTNTCIKPSSNWIWSMTMMHLTLVFRKMHKEADTGVVKLQSLGCKDPRCEFLSWLQP